MHTHVWEDQGGGGNCEPPHSWKCTICNKVVFSDDRPPEHNAEESEG